MSVPDGPVWILLFYWDFHSLPSLVFKGSIPKRRNIQFPEGRCDVSGQRRMGRLVEDHREATVARITTDDSRGLIQYGPGTQPVHTESRLNQGWLSTSFQFFFIKKPNSWDVTSLLYSRVFPNMQNTTYPQLLMLLSLILKSNYVLLFVLHLCNRRCCQSCRLWGMLANGFTGSPSFLIVLEMQTTLTVNAVNF